MLELQSNRLKLSEVGMKNQIMVIALILSVTLTFVACGDSGTETIEQNDHDTTSSIELSENIYENDFVEFEIPNGWSIFSEDTISVTITPPNDDGTIKSVSIQFIETNGVIDAKQYVDATLRGVRDGQKTIKDANSNDVTYLEVTGLVPGSEMNSYLWQYATDTDDGNIIRISVTGTSEQNGILDALLYSIKVLK